MGLRSQFEGLVELKSRWKHKADFYLVYGREAFPMESKWPSPVPDGNPVANATTVEQRCDVAQRFLDNVSQQIPVLIDDMDNTAMRSYDAYPFRLYAIDTDGKISVPSTKGAAGFSKTVDEIESWLQQLDERLDEQLDDSSDEALRL